MCAVIASLVASLYLLRLFSVSVADAPLPFVWIGNVTSSSFTVHVDVRDIAAELHRLPLSISLHTDLLADALRVTPQNVSFPASHNTVRVYLVQGLRAGATYHFGFQKTLAARLSLGSVATFPSSPEAEVYVAFGSCQRGRKNAKSFSKLSALLPDSSDKIASFVLHLGDLHYNDIDENDIAKIRDAMQDTVTFPETAQLFSSRQVSYIYDDHDFGGNNADSSSKSRLAAVTNYDRMVPHPREGSRGAIPVNYHAFAVASVRFIVSDLRSEANKTAGYLMSPEQLVWFFDELRSAKKYSVVVWASSRPWIGPEDLQKDHWGAYYKQRKKIADYIASNNITNLIMVSGDAHMLAADDGTNSNYASSNLVPAGFPVLQSAPFANYGSSKGGPFTEGCHAYRYSYNYHFSILRIYKTNQGDGPCISYQGFAVEDDAPKITFEKCGVLGGVRGISGGSQGPRCKIKLFRKWQIMLLVLGNFLILSALNVGVVALYRWKCGKLQH